MAPIIFNITKSQKAKTAAMISAARISGFNAGFISGSGLAIAAAFAGVEIYKAVQCCDCPCCDPIEDFDCECACSKEEVKEEAVE